MQWIKSDVRVLALQRFGIYLVGEGDSDDGGELTTLPSSVVSRLHQHVLACSPLRSGPAVQRLLLHGNHPALRCPAHPAPVTGAERVVALSRDTLFNLFSSAHTLALDAPQDWSSVQWSVDHIVPVKHHGLDHWCNYCLMPQRVNSAFGKHAVAKGGVPKHWVVGEAAYKSAVRFHAAWMRLTLGELSGAQAGQGEVVSQAVMAEPTEPVLDWPTVEAASWQAHRTAAARQPGMVQQQQQQGCAYSLDLPRGQQQTGEGLVEAGAADVCTQSPAGDALPVGMTHHVSARAGQPGTSHLQAGAEQSGAAPTQDDDQPMQDLASGASVTHRLPDAQLQQDPIGDGGDKGAASSDCWRAAPCEGREQPGASSDEGYEVDSMAVEVAQAMQADGAQATASGDSLDLVQSVQAHQQPHTQTGRGFRSGRSPSVLRSAAPVATPPQQDEQQGAATSQEAGSGSASPSDSDAQPACIVNPFDRFRRLAAGVPK